MSPYFATTSIICKDLVTKHRKPGINRQRCSCSQSKDSRQRIEADIPSDADDVLFSPYIQVDATPKRVQLSLIINAIRRVYDTQVCQLFARSGQELPIIPAIDSIPPQPTEHATVDSILEDESTVPGNLGVSSNIFRQQSWLADNFSRFANDLIPIVGDQKTCQTMRRCSQNRNLVTETSYDSIRWLLPIPGLWHVWLNYLRMIMTHCYGGQSYSSQYSASD